MSRVQLDLPTKFVFTTNIPLRVSDINYGGHLGHDSVLTLTHEARVRFLAKHGLTEMNVYGAGLIISDAVIVYKSEAFWGEGVKIQIAIAEFNKYGFDLIYRVTEKKTRREIARVKTGMVFFDYKKRKVVRVPPRFKKLF
jgi:acyl-CoA thioester hydrolase